MGIKKILIFIFILSAKFVDAQIHYSTTLGQFLGGFAIPNTIEVAPNGNGCLETHYQNTFYVTHLDSANQQIWSAYYYGYPSGAIQLSVDSQIYFSTNYSLVSTTTDLRSKYFFALAIDSTLLVTGGYYSRLTPHVAISCVDTSGNLLWNKNYSLPSAGNNFYQPKILYAQISNSIFVIEHNSILRLDTSGAIYWRKDFFSNNNLKFIDFAIGNNGNLFILGSDSLDIVLMKIDTNGILLSNKFLDSGGIDYPNSIDIYPNQNLILCSAINGSYNFIKCDSSFNIIIAKAIPTTFGTFSQLKVRDDNNLIVSSGYSFCCFDSILNFKYWIDNGYFGSTMYGSNSSTPIDFELIPDGIFSVNDERYYDWHMGWDWHNPVVRKLGLLGELCSPADINNNSYANANYTIVSKPLIDSLSIPSVTSNYTVSDTTFLITTSNLTSCIVGINDFQTIQNSVSISPNPTTTTFTIKNFSSKEKSLVQIINVLGEIIFSVTTNEKQITINEKLPQGIYFVRVRDEGKSVTRKLVVE